MCHKCWASSSLCRLPSTYGCTEVLVIKSVDEQSFPSLHHRWKSLKRLTFSARVELPAAAAAGLRFIYSYAKCFNPHSAPVILYSNGTLLKDMQSSGSTAIS